jgi:hypothetical protein
MMKLQAALAFVTGLIVTRGQQLVENGRKGVDATMRGLVWGREALQALGNRFSTLQADVRNITPGAKASTWWCAWELEDNKFMWS